MTLAIYPGSFDPMTNGHIDVVLRAARTFEEVVIAPVQTNNKSSKLFDTEERVELIREALRDVPNIRVQSYTGLTVHFAAQIGASVIIRGLRLVSDYEYELQLAQNNASQNPNIETCCLVTSPSVSYISSSMVKDIAKWGGDISRMVPSNIAVAVYKAFNVEMPKAAYTLTNSNGKH
jgi:pantetheine-phosphate adenylyltransferase